MMHILKRAGLHIACSAMAVLGLYWVLRLLLWEFDPGTVLPNGWLLIFSTALLLIIVLLREPFDVEDGDPAYKSICDFISWVIGAAAACAAIYYM